LCGLVFRSALFALAARAVTLGVRDAALRHGVWTTVLVCVALLPAADALLPASLHSAGVPEVILPVPALVTPAVFAEAGREAAAAAVPYRIPAWDVTVVLVAKQDPPVEHRGQSHTV
jgi:hypothetical protein